MFSIQIEDKTGQEWELQFYCKIPVGTILEDKFWNKVKVIKAYNVEKPYIGNAKEIEDLISENFAPFPLEKEEE